MSNENSVIVSPTERRKPAGWTPPPEVFAIGPSVYINSGVVTCHGVIYRRPPEVIISKKQSPEEMRESISRIMSAYKESKGDEVCVISHNNDFAPGKDIREIVVKPLPNKPYYRQKSRW